MSSGATPTYFLPYPIQTDPVDVASDIEALALSIDTQLTLTAPILSPELTGIPKSVTPNTSDNSTRIATTEYVKGQGYLTVGTASSTFSTIDSPVFTGTPLVPTATTGTSNAQIASTEFVSSALSNHSSATTGIHGVSGSIVGTSSSQTLTNKVIDGITNTLQNIPQSSITGLSGAYSPLNLTLNMQTGSYTLTLSDTARQIEIESSSSNYLYVPTDASVSFPIGTSLIVVQTGTGQTTISSVDPGTTVINGTPGLKLRAQWSAATLVKRSTNKWLVFGDVVA